MFVITFSELMIAITVLWIITRAVICIKNRNCSLANEAKMLLVYVCLVVIARMVYFPMHHINGHIGTLPFDSSKPLWINLVPIVHLFDVYDGWIINIIGNITMFIPVGIVWPVCFKKLDTFGKTVLAGFGYTLLIEISQIPFYDRCSDVDDIILNTTGMAIGALIVFGIRKLRKEKEEKLY